MHFPLEIIGYLAAILMGGVLGGIGGGGSILTVPILVYLMKIDPVVATGYSLLIVGAAAGFGAFRYWRKGLVPVQEALTFAIPSIVGVYLTRAYIVPNLPDPLLTAPIVVSRGDFIMVLFGGLMVLASAMMLRGSRKEAPVEIVKPKVALIIAEGLFVGFITGILGAGGGFLIIPALVLFVGLPMKQAVGASLMIIALKSLIGFIGDLQAGIPLQMPMLAIFFGCTFLGMWIATHFADGFDGKKLQKFFAYFTIIVAVIIFIEEIL